MDDDTPDLDPRCEVWGEPAHVRCVRRKHRTGPHIFRCPWLRKVKI